MLQHRAVYPETLELLKQLMSLPGLDDFYLVGGTALALQIGHRISIDLDFFAHKDFNPDVLKLTVEKYITISDHSTDKNMLSLYVIYPPKTQNIVKVDFLKYKYPLLKPLITEDGLRLASIEDIIPMKLSAIANRGTKKDFYDLYFLLKMYDLETMLDLFKQKFKITNLFHLIKSLVYFDDAEIEPDPILIKQTEWQVVKETITDAVKTFLNRTTNLQ